MPLLVELLQFLQENCSELLTYGFMNVEMIDSDAGLTTIEELAEEDAIDSWGNFGSFINNHRAFTT